jgi:uncharacterized protein (DUF1015 family)
MRPMTTTGLELAPFRGVRYAPERVSDLGAVTSPPYDVVEPDGLAALEAADQHNVVRLILPREDDCGAEGRYTHAADLLHRWIGDGTLVTEAAPALYVYEQRRDDTVYRGLLGALGLRRPEERIVLPHEDTMPGPVTDRLGLMRAAGANLEPILLTYQGGGRASEVVDEVVDGGEPLLRAQGADATHRIWRLGDPTLLAAVADDLRPRQALIADGHHRYAAYLRLQGERRASDGPGPWDRGLALLVDAAAHPLQLRAIHRVVRGRSASELAAALPERDWRVVRASEAAATADLLAAVEGLGPRRNGFVVTDAASSWLVERLSAPGRGEPAQGPTRLDTVVLHEELLPGRWEVRDQDSQVEYHHDADAARAAAVGADGAALLLKATTVEAVLAAAAAGHRMPRKSTSFGPKPVTGLLLRTFAAG